MTDSVAPRWLSFDRLLRKPLRLLLQQGLSPERLAACLVLGFLLGVFPLPGSTTLLCASVALLMGLNLAAMQLVNYMVYPLQLILLVPFMQIGRWLFGSRGEAVSPRTLQLALHAGWAAAFHSLAGLVLQAIGAWFVLAPPVALLLYPLLRTVLRRLSRRTGWMEVPS